MRILFLSQGRKPEDHPGYHAAMVRLLSERTVSFYHNLPYIGFSEQYGFDALWDEVFRQAKEHEADVVYFQYFHRKANDDPSGCIARLRALPWSPTIAVSCGDAFSSNWMWPHFPDSLKACTAHSDLTFSTQMGRCGDLMIQWGAKNIVLLPHALCQVRFSAEICANQTDRKEPFDLVWVGSKRRQKPNVWNRIFWNGRKRAKIVKLFTKRYGSRFGLFGHRWEGNPSWQGYVPFAEQQDAFRQGRIFVDAIPDPFGEMYYTSDRPFFALASGVPVVLFEKPGLDRIFRRNEHAYYVKDEAGLIATCDQLLEADPSDLHKKAAETAAYIGAKHTQYHRMQFVVETVRQYRIAKAEKRKAAVPHLPFLLPEVCQREEAKLAVRNWVG